MFVCPDEAVETPSFQLVQNILETVSPGLEHFAKLALYLINIQMLYN